MRVEVGLWGLTAKRRVHLEDQQSRVARVVQLLDETMPPVLFTDGSTGDLFHEPQAVEVPQRGTGGLLLMAVDGLKNLDIVPALWHPDVLVERADH